MHKIKLGVKDWKILAELDKDCRQSDARIGKKVGLSQQVVSYRVNRLIDGGVIRQFYTVIDLTKLGYSIYKAYFNLQIITKETEEDIKKFIINHKNIVWAGVLDGTWDLSMTVAAKSAKEFDTILKKFTSRFNDHIFNKTVLLVVEASDFIIGYNEETKMVDLGIDDNIVDIDDMDCRILSFIAVNARMPYVELAKACGTSIDVVRYRLKKLKELGVIKGFRVWFEPSLTGKNLYKILLSLQNLSPLREKNLLGYCRRSSNVTYALKSIGVWDFKLELLLKDTRELHKVIVDMRNKFSDIIRNYETIHIFEEYKRNYCVF